MKPNIKLYQDILPVFGFHLMRVLEETPWTQNTLHIYGRDVLEPRLTAMYGDVDYRYSGVTKKSLPWSPLILELKQLVEETSGCEFNTCLLNYYRDGKDSIGLHADDEPELGENPDIATLSLGGTRLFELLSNCGNFHEKILLHYGDLLIMSEDTQLNWKHRIQKEPSNHSPRVSLTFRKIFT